MASAVGARHFSPQNESRRSSTPSMTSASSVYDDDSVGSPPEHWQQFGHQDGIGRTMQEGQYAPAFTSTNSSSTQDHLQELHVRSSMNKPNGVAPDDVVSVHSITHLYNRSSPSPTVGKTAALSMPPPPLPNKDLRHSHLLKSANDLKIAAISSLRNKGSRKNLFTTGLPVSPKPKTGLPTSPKPVVNNFSTSGTAIRVATRESPSIDYFENRASREKSHTQSRSPTFTNSPSPLGLSSTLSPASAPDNMLSRIGRNIARRSVQQKTQSEAFEEPIIDVQKETADYGKPALTLDIAPAAYESEQEPTWQLENTALDADLAVPPLSFQAHTRNASSIYSAGSQTLVPDQTFSTHSTTPEPSTYPSISITQSAIATSQPVVIPAPRAIPYDAFDIPPPPLANSHFMCYQKHTIMKLAANRHAPVPCMVCWTVDSEERVRCTFCAMRVCKRCADRLAEDPGRSLGRLVEAIERGA